MGLTDFGKYDRIKGSKNSKEYSSDGIHLNAEAFEVWTSFVKPYLALLSEG